MKTFYKTAIATGLSLIALLFVATTVSADGLTPTPTPTATPTKTATPTPTGTLTATPTPVVESHVECTTGAYGQQNCKIVTTSKTVSPVVAAGMQENIMMALVVVFALSTTVYTYSKVRA